MAVSGSARIYVEPIASILKGFYRWHANITVAGDGSGGGVDFTAFFDSSYMFGGQWGFTLETFNFSTTAATVTPTGRVMIRGETDDAYSNIVDWSRYFNIEANTGYIHATYMDRTRSIFKPRRTGALPAILAYFYPNTNACSFMFRCQGYVAIEGSEAYARLATR